MGFRLEFHLGRHFRIYAGQFSCKDADFIQRGSGFLSSDSHIPRTDLHICKSLWHDSWGIIPVSKFISVEIVKIRNLRYRIFRELAFFYIFFCKIIIVIHAKPSFFCPFHLLDRSFSPESTTKFRCKWSGTKMYQINLSKWRFHITSVTGFL